MLLIEKKEKVGQARSRHAGNKLLVLACRLPTCQSFQLGHVLLLAYLPGLCAWRVATTV
jgi:hypothetical protein